MSQKQLAEKALLLKQANDQRRRVKATAALDFTDYPDRLLTAAEASEVLGVSTQTLANWRWAGKGPRYVRINKQTIRYPRDSIEAFAGTELAVREPDAELSDAALVKEIARLANRLARRHGKAA
jgi:predicted DNA-binding transcriptional regulator AlpA